MSKFSYYIVYLKHDNSPIIPLLDEIFSKDLKYKELIDNKILSYKLNKDVNLLINSYSDRTAASSIKSFITNISKINTKKDNIKNDLLNELKECNNVLSISYDNFPLYMEEKITTIASKVKGIIVDDKMNSYFPSPKGLKDLLTNTGTSSFRFYNPIIDQRQKRKTVITTKEDKLRCKRNLDIIKSEGMIPASVSEFEILDSNTSVTPFEDLWNELVISHIVGYLSYCSLNDIDFRNEYEEYKKIYDLNNMLKDHSSKSIIDAILQNKLKNEDLTFYTHYCEISLILLWTLSLTKYPTIKKKCDILKQSSVFKNKEKSDKLFELAKIRSKNELLDMFDLTSKLYEVEELKKGIDKDIISFHLSAFIFILNFDY